MANVNWTIKAREFVNCNCSYGCPCQFNALPTYGDCLAVSAMQIDQGHHGETRLDVRWPGAIHEGKGEAAVVIDERANEAQRAALMRIVTGQDTEPTIFQVFSTTFEKLQEPIFAPIDFDVDIDGRKGRVIARGVTEGRGEPIKNPVTGAEHASVSIFPTVSNIRSPKSGAAGLRCHVRCNSNSPIPMRNLRMSIFAKAELCAE